MLLLVLAQALVLVYFTLLRLSRRHVQLSHVRDEELTARCETLRTASLHNLLQLLLIAALHLDQRVSNTTVVYAVSGADHMDNLEHKARCAPRVCFVCFKVHLLLAVIVVVAVLLAKLWLLVLLVLLVKMVRVATVATQRMAKILT